MMKLIIVSEIPDPSMEPVLQLSVTPKRLPNDIDSEWIRAVAGVKWVSNKWVREGAQLWAHPCTLL